jgi:hypothetical protein
MWVSDFALVGREKPHRVGLFNAVIHMLGLRYGAPVGHNLHFKRAPITAAVRTFLL